MMSKRTTAERLWDEIEGFIEAGHCEAFYSGWEKMHLTEKRSVKREIVCRIQEVLDGVQTDVLAEVTKDLGRALGRAL
jgi:hypothetical protein